MVQSTCSDRKRRPCSSQSLTQAHTCAHAHCRGSYSADNWGVVQTISWPGSGERAAWDGEGTFSPYGGIQETLPCTGAQALTLCTPPGGTPAVKVGEWGVSVDVSGQWLIVGAYKSDVSPGTQTGAAFIYQKIASTGDFAYRQALTAITTTDQHCGWDVAISGSSAIVGCYGSATVAGTVSFYESDQPDGSAAGPISYGQVSRVQRGICCHKI